jgi:hypothetical protein
MSGLHDKQYMESQESEMRKAVGKICIGMAVYPTDEYPNVAGYLGLVFVTQKVLKEYDGEINKIPGNKTEIMYVTQDPEWNDTGHVTMLSGENHA